MEKRFSKIAHRAGLFTVILGVVGLLAWLADLPTITSLGKEYVPSSPPAGIGHAIIGMALLLFPRAPSSRSLNLSSIFAVGAILLGVAGLMETFVHASLGPSHLFSDRTTTSSGHLAVQLSPISAVAFMLLGGSVLLLRSKRALLHDLSGLCALGVLLIHLVVILGYIYGTPILYGGSIRPVSALSAVASVILPVGIISLIEPDRFPLRLISGETVSARLLRAILPATFAATLIGQLFSDLLRREPVMNLAVQDAIQTLVFSLLVTYIVLRTTQEIGKKMEESERKRRAVEQELLTFNRELEERVRERTIRLQQLNEELQTEITSRGQIAEALRASERRNRALLEAVPDWILCFSADGELIDHRSPRGTDGPEQGAVPLLDELASASARYLPAAFQGEDVFTTDMQVHWNDKVLDFELRMARSGGSEIFAILRDITELKGVEDEVLSATIREQRRIGEELHDGLGQHLTGIGFMIKALQESLREKAPVECEEAEQIGGEIVKSVGQVRSISRGLFLTEMGSKGLLNALQELSQSTARIFKVKCTVECALEAGHLANRTVNFHLYRIVQEAITNAIKHGRATHIHVELSLDQDRCALRVTDNGSGMSARAQAAGIGLKIMEYRSRRIGGSLRISSPASGGTMITCRFPALEQFTERVIVSPQT